MASQTITFEHRVNGVLVDADNVVLRDAEGAFGVRREDTGEVVVAANTEMTRTSSVAGRYTHTFAEPAPGLSYTAVIEWTHDGDTERETRRLAQPVLNYANLAQILEPRRQAEFQRDIDSDEAAQNLAIACEWVERETNQAVPLSRRTLTLDAWPAGDLKLWPVPLASVEDVAYDDADGVEQTLPASSFQVLRHRRPGVIRLKPGVDRPQLADTPGSVRIAYTVGHADVGQAPATLLAAVRILASHLYEEREIVSPTQLHEVPMGVRRLLDLNRFVRLEGE